MATTVNLGAQRLTFRFKQPAEGQEFNQLLRSIQPAGVYNGGVLEYSGMTLKINPFDAIIYARNRADIAAHVRTNATVTLTAPPSNGNHYVYMVFDWADSINNFCAFATRSTVSPSVAGELILGTFTIQGAPAAYISSFTPKGRTLGFSKESYIGDITKLITDNASEFNFETSGGQNNWSLIDGDSPNIVSSQVELNLNQLMTSVQNWRLDVEPGNEVNPNWVQYTKGRMALRLQFTWNLGLITQTAYKFLKLTETDTIPISASGWTSLFTTIPVFIYKNLTYTPLGYLMNESWSYTP